MKKLLYTFLAILTIGNFSLRADEGMWIPMLIEDHIYEEMKAMGLRLSADDIYSVNQSSLKDAVVIFGRGCTGEIISGQGLLLTNHHCGYGQIQSHSTIEHDYLSDGFWAMSMEEELPNPGLSAKFLIRIEDVTEQALDGVTPGMSEDERGQKVAENITGISKEATEDTHYNAVIRSFFAGNEYYLFVYETFQDVRLVGTPPSSIGKFGADTDNWMWPRHTGDFSMFRVYTAPDGTPAPYSEENVPLKPRHYLPISLDGVEEGDFSMILGYPGGTQRYLTSYGVDLAINKYNPTVVSTRQEKLDIMRAAMDADPAVRIQYATKYARTSNYWKYFIGQTRGLKRLKVYDKKIQQEQAFRNWAEANPGREKKYGRALDYIKEGYAILGRYTIAGVYEREAVRRGPELLGFASSFKRLHDALTADNVVDEKVATITERLSQYSKEYFEDYHLATDMQIFASMMRMFHMNVPAGQQPEMLKEAAAKYKGDFYAWAEDVYGKSIFSTLESVEEFLEKPKAKKIEKDPAFDIYSQFMAKFDELTKQKSEARDLLDKGNRLFVAGLREMYPEKTFYPDANFTMRITYGTVQDYKAADAVFYNYYTTLQGVMEKEDPDNWEFVVPDKLKELYESKDYGEYGEDGVMKVCFLTDHDITGGNSGSPVINGRGELIGIAFDGNWEAMSGDIAFEPEVQRTINVDIRYVMFIIDKYAGAQNLIDEMTLVKTPPPVKITIPREEFLEKLEMAM